MKGGVLWRLLSAVGLVALVACSHQPPVLGLHLRGDARLNPDGAGASLPVVVYVYQLKRPDRFNQADFRALWKSPSDALADDLVERQELTLRPGEERDVEVKRNLDSRYLGVVALFRTPEGDRWRRLLPLTEKQRQLFRLALRDSQVELDAEKRGGLFGGGSSEKAERKESR